jgi:hypothetical protein
MCWNLNISILSFAIGAYVAFKLYKRGKENDVLFASLILFYSSIQLAEYFIWLSLETNNEAQNIFATKVAYFSLWSHLFAIGLGLYIEKGIKGPMIAGLLFLLYGMVVEPSFRKSEPTGDSHLRWGFDTKYYVMVFLACAYVFYNYTNERDFKIASMFYIGSFLLATLTQKSGSASYWCWFSAFFSFFLLYR